MKGIVGDWNRLVQESSYLECTNGRFGVIMNRVLWGCDASASGLMSWRIGPARAAREDRTLPLSGNESHVLPRDPAHHTPRLNDKGRPDAPQRDICTHKVDRNRRYFVEVAERVIYWIFIYICSKRRKKVGVNSEACIGQTPLSSRCPEGNTMFGL